MPVAKTKTTPTLTDLLFEKADVGLCLVAPDGTVLRTNAAWLHSTGYTEEQVVGESIVELFPATRDMSRAMHAYARAGHRVEVPPHVPSRRACARWRGARVASPRHRGGVRRPPREALRPRADRAAAGVAASAGIGWNVTRASTCRP
jgi:PAS domain S-box-containing protein